MKNGLPTDIVPELKKKGFMQERAKKTRDRILAKALEMFAADGFHGTRVDAVAEAAKVNKQRIYAYFKSKSGLFEQCLVSIFNEVNLFESENLKLPEDDFQALTAILLREYMSLHEKYPYFWRMLAWANLEGTSAAEQLMNIKAENFRRIRQAFDHAVASGKVADGVSFETYIFHIMAVSYFYFSNRLTLTRTLSEQMFTAEGRRDFITESAKLIAR